MFKKKLGFLLGIMVLLSVAGYMICQSTEKKQWTKEEDFLLVTSFYPMYVLAQNITEDVEGISVANLTENQTGCLHDYQLTAKDMKLLSNADAFLINGAGMELFIDKVVSQLEDLPMIEASHGISLLEGIEHNHSHEEEHEHVYEGEESHEHSQNGHVWMDMERYQMQISTTVDKLKELLPQKAEALNTAGKRYQEEVQDLLEEFSMLKQEMRGLPVVIFHEAFAYLAEELEMEVIAVLSLDEETMPSASEIAEVMEEINYHGSAFIFIEEEYASHADKIIAETSAKVAYLDPLVTGTGEGDSYLVGMEQNLQKIKEFVRKVE